jgi:hypothetical protein
MGRDVGSFGSIQDEVATILTILASKMPVQGGRYLCLVDDCPWHVDVPESVTHDWKSAALYTIMAGVTPQELEAMLQRHYESHSVLEWAKTCARLQRELASRV